MGKVHFKYEGLTVKFKGAQWFCMICLVRDLSLRRRKNNQYINNYPFTK